MIHTRALKALRSSKQRVSHRNLKRALWQSRNADIIHRLKVACPGHWLRIGDEWRSRLGGDVLFVCRIPCGMWLAGTHSQKYYAAQTTSLETSIKLLLSWIKKGWTSF